MVAPGLAAPWVLSCGVGCLLPLLCHQQWLHRESSPRAVALLQPTGQVCTHGVLSCSWASAQECLEERAGPHPFPPDCSALQVGLWCWGSPSPAMPAQQGSSTVLCCLLGCSRAAQGCEEGPLTGAFSAPWPWPPAASLVTWCKTCPIKRELKNPILAPAGSGHVQSSLVFT